MAETEFARAERYWHETCRLERQLAERDATIKEQEEKYIAAQATIAELRDFFEGYAQPSSFALGIFDRISRGEGMIDTPESTKEKT